jgi:hypothetical protein
VRNATERLERPRGEGHVAEEGAGRGPVLDVAGVRDGPGERPPPPPLRRCRRRRLPLRLAPDGVVVVGLGLHGRDHGGLALGGAAAAGGDGVEDNVGDGIREADAEASLEEAGDQRRHLAHRQPVQRRRVEPVDGLEKRRSVLDEAPRRVASVGAVGVGRPAPAATLARPRHDRSESRRGDNGWGRRSRDEIGQISLRRRRVEFPSLASTKSSFYFV